MLSIIIPVYNVEAYVGKCIRSVLEQSFQDWEMILVDDGSTDDSGRICDEFSIVDERIKVFHQENQGVSMARNKGLDLSNGEFVFFIDADDWIDEGCLENMIPKDEIDMCVCGMKRIYSSEGGYEVTYVDQWPKRKTVTFDTENLYYEVLNVYGSVANKVIRKSCIGKTRFSSEHIYGEDLLFFVEIINNMKTATVIKKGYYNYLCTREGNTFSSIKPEYAYDSIACVQELYLKLAQRGYSTCGVNRIRIAIRDIQRKLKYLNDKRIKKICFETLKMPGFKNIIMFLFDFKVSSLKHKILFLYLLIYFMI